MTFQELLKDERAEGKAENVLELLQELGTVSEELQKHIMGEKWNKIAAKSGMIDDFVSRM